MTDARPAAAHPPEIGKALAQRLGVSRSLLYMYVTRDGTPTEAGRKLLGV